MAAAPQPLTQPPVRVLVWGEAQEMYGEFFDIPVPDELVFVGNFSGGEDAVGDFGV